MRLRLRRKRLASVCLFAVLTAVVLGVRASASFPDWLAAVATLAIALFVIRAYKTVTPYGWA